MGGSTETRYIGAAIDGHRYLGPGMLEHTYEVGLEAALRQRGRKVERQVPVRVRYLYVDLDWKGVKKGCPPTRLTPL